ncbi:TniB family NTP-binding protein [Streptomyces sp. NPDC057617]|uniref:TniB family NTP-binding protein n=1 Tax=Streptomyces sp. NPDC057617 TaxID=3346184 RepID=UPI0036AC2AAB
MRLLAPSEPDIPETLPADVDRDRMAYHARLTVIAPDVAQAEELVLLNEHATGARHGMLLYGPAGTGKTIALTEIIRHHRIRLRRLPEPHRSASPLVYVHVPPAATPRMLIVELVRGLGIPFRAGCSSPELARLAEEALKDCPPALVLVDEAHNIRPASPAAASVRDMLDYLCDRVPATFIYAGIGTTDSLTSAVTVAAHRRLIPVVVHALIEGEAWRAFIAEVEQALRLREHTVGTLQHADLLHRLTAGTPLRVSYLLGSAAIQAIRDGTERITGQALTALFAPWSLQDLNSR